MSTFRLVPMFALILATPLAQAQTIGKPAPDYKIKDDENRQQQKEEERFLIEEQRGSMVLMYFWRTSSLESIEKRADIKKLGEKYKKRGLRVIDLVVDPKQKYEDFAKDNEIEDISDNGRWYGTRVIQPSFGAYSEPYVVLVDGRSIIRWRGHPADKLEQRIQHFLKRYPPPAGNEDWLVSRLQDSEKLAEKRQFGKAYTAAKEVADFTDDSSSHHATAESKMESLEGKAGEWLKEAIELEQNADYDNAARIVAEISIRYAETDVARDAEVEIGRMNGRLELKKKIREAMNNVKGEVLLDEAAQLAESGDYETALELLEKVRDEEAYEDTKAAKTAKKTIERIEGDAEAQQAIAAKRAERMADRYLDIAERFTKSQMYDEARSYYEKLVAEYPDSDIADQAKDALKNLPA